MIANYAPTWDDPTASWWVKTNRARVHINTLGIAVDEYRDSEPYSLTPEPTGDPNRTAYRLRFLKPVPVEISATVGDVLNNLRGALESLAYEIARLGLGGSFVDEKQERVPTFPVCVDPPAFDKFIREQTKRGLHYTVEATAALRSVQPFVNLEAAGAAEMSITYADWFLLSELHRLDRLWNIDKHRRLAVLAWWPDYFWWGSNGPTQRRLLRGDDTMEDGSVLFFVEGVDEGQSNEINHDFKLMLTDDPACSFQGLGPIEDAVSLLDRIHEHIVRFVVFPRVFTLMSQTPAPSGP